MLKYMRQVCGRHGIGTDREKPLHSLMGEYLKVLRTENLISSAMTERILKSSISLLEAFNQVRNEESLAHDNELPGHAEAILIFNNITSTVRFITAIERKPEAKAKAKSADGDLDELPF